MNVLRTAAVLLLALVVVAAAGYAAIGLLLTSTDQSTYTTNTTADYEYDTVLASAEAAGFSVRPVNSSGVHPDGIEELDAELGPGYEIFSVTYVHDDGSQLRANVFAAEGKTELVLFGPGYEPLDPDALPEAWLVDRITLLLGVDETTAERYVDEMRNAATDGDMAIPQTYADERLQFASVYAELDARSTPVVSTSEDGQGWVEYRYMADGKEVGGLAFIVERAELTDRDGQYTYVLNIDRVGGIGVSVHGPAGKEITEVELRESIRERFVAVGIPGSAADDLTFEYDGSVW